MTESANETVDDAAPSSAGGVRKLVSFFEPVLVSVRFWWAICLACAAILDLSERHYLNPDGLSYLDMATGALRSGPAALLNGYWNPAYPALLSLALAIFHPSRDHEIPIVYLVNFFIFALTLWGFTYFLRQWLKYADTLGSSSDRYKRYFVPFAFSTFLLFMLKESDYRAAHPDMLAAAIIFFAVGATCRLSLSGSSKKHYAALGLALGIVYYARVALFPLSMIFLIGLLIYPPSRQVSRRRLLLSLSVFLLVAAPQVVFFSEQAGHFSLGEGSSVNYAWHVNEVQPPWLDLTGPHAVSPTHPPRRLMESPLIFEFGSPVKGTVPLWYDPVYWYGGARVHFHLSRLIATIKSNLENFREIFDQRRVFFSGAVVLLVLAAFGAGFSNMRRSVWILAWPLIAMAMHGLVHVEYRYIAAFILLLCIATYGVLVPRVNNQAARAVCATVAVAMLIPFAGNTAITGAQTLKGMLRPRKPDYVVIALGLRDLGVKQGDNIAVVGWPSGPIYAHYGGLRVTAAIMDTDGFWKLSPQELESVAQRLQAAGIKAVVASDRPQNATPGNWRDIDISGSEQYFKGSQHYSVLLLSDLLPKDATH